MRKTGRCVVVHEAPLTCGFGSEIAARIMERCFLELEAPVQRVAGFDTTMPYYKLELDYLPDDAFEHDGQITKRETRAVTLSTLAPRPGQMLWDVGAGAGSIAIEWLRAEPAMRGS